MISRREALSKIGSCGGGGVYTEFRPSRSLRLAAPRKPIRRVSSRIRRAIFLGRSPIPIPISSRIDPSFNALRVGNTPIQRLWTGGCGAKGPPGTGRGNISIWSDIPNNRQIRWIEDDGRVTVFRKPSGNSNGNTFDHQGRQFSCEHRAARRALRARRIDHRDCRFIQGKRLNSPNDVAPPCRRQLLVYRSPVRRVSSMKACPMWRAARAISRDV